MSGYQHLDSSEPTGVNFIAAFMCADPKNTVKSSVEKMLTDIFLKFIDQANMYNNERIYKFYRQ